MTAKEKKINDYKDKIPALLEHFKLFLKTKNLDLGSFIYSEDECNQIEKIMGAYFKGHESEYLDLENYRPMIKKPELLKNDKNYDAFAVYIGEFMIHNTPSDYDLGRTKTVWEGEITWNFKNIGSWSITPESIIHVIILKKTEGRSLFQRLNKYINDNNKYFKS